MKKWWIVGMLLWAGVARADWSPEILLWENPPDAEGGGTDAAIAVDSLGHVHMVFSHIYHHPTDPWIPVHVGFRYVQFDNNGLQLTPQIFLSDSLDDSGGYPLIRFFGQDSIWAMWVGSRAVPPQSAQKYASLDLIGNLLHVAQDFPRPRWPGGYGFEFDVRGDRTVVIADASGLGDTLFATVQLPEGQRIMNDEVVWSEPGGCWSCAGYIDNTDSLQLVWTQGHYGEWWAAFAKRIDTQTPFDSSQRSAHVELTAREAYGAYGQRAINDSLMAVAVSYPAAPYQGELRLYRRDTYEQIAQVSLGAATSSGDIGLEGDSVISVMSGSDGAQEVGIYLRRFRISGLEAVQDTLVVQRSPSLALGLRAYARTPSGTQHMLYVRQEAPSGPGSIRLFYRYSPYVPNVTRPRPAIITENYSIYPNPTNGTITLTGPLHLLRAVRLFNTLGQCLSTYSVDWRTLQRLEFSIALENLPSGKYFLELQEMHRVINKRVQFIR